MITKESPSYIKTSLAGAICLGMENGQFMRGATCSCLNLLLTYESGCTANCSYCGLSSSREKVNKPTFIRVKWPVYKLEDILAVLDKNEHPFRRICVSMTTHPRALQDTCAIIRECSRRTDLPISGLLTPTVMNGKADMIAIKKAGADRVGIAVDTATESLFEKFRGSNVRGPHKWERYWESLEEAVDVFGRYNVGVHLIVGLGETEKEMVSVIDKAYKLGALTHLFSFFPEAGSQMESFVQPTVENYRRIQLARYLINEGIIKAGQVEYDKDDNIIGFGIDAEPYIKQGIAFMTSGCPGRDGFLACNRPFGNERPSQTMRNYPFIPEEEDIALIRSQVSI